MNVFGGTGNRVRILLADDHPLVLERVKALSQSAFEVVGVAHDGLEMVDQAIQLSPDIIVADISMPELDGIQAAHRLREIGVKAPIVFLTIYESPEFVEACLAEALRRLSSETVLMPVLSVLDDKRNVRFAPGGRNLLFLAGALHKRRPSVTCRLFRPI
jgi:CheY-like chemotaxis protein